MESTQAPARSVDRRIWVPVLMLLMATLITLIVIFTDQGQELTPDRRDDGHWVLGIALGFGVLCFVAMLRGRQRKAKTYLTATISSLLVAFVCTPVTGVTIARIREISDFSGGAVVESVQHLPIRSASIERGRGIRYSVWLRDAIVLLDVDPADYRAAFGTAGQVRPVGYCIRATVQSNGAASRITAANGISLPPGSLEHCPRV
ncbi:hypothetical protein DMC47_33265 [Nostoc sp. 3335mG]|nr:hypothetical protein DMC47_33265 [Nostoc sp. 3335mG]